MSTCKYHNVVGYNLKIFSYFFILRLRILQQTNITKDNSAYIKNAQLHSLKLNDYRFFKGKIIKISSATKLNLKNL